MTGCADCFGDGFYPCISKTGTLTELINETEEPNTDGK